MRRKKPILKEKPKRPNNRPPFQKGNQWWKARSTHGKKAMYETPTILMDACQEYFQWNEDNPLRETKVFHSNGFVTEHEVSHPRAMTVAGLCMFLGFTIETWYNYKRKGGDYLFVCKIVEETIRRQKFEGAAAGFFNHAIIARDLGLVDKRETNSTGQIDHRHAHLHKIDMSALKDNELDVLVKLITSGKLLSDSAEEEDYKELPYKQ